MEQESFKGDKLISKTIYNEDQSVKGKEVYSYTGNSKYPSGSKYYDGNGMIQSTYKFEYQDSLKVKSQGFEGEDGELLRVEGFNYDNKGNMVRKTIYNELQQKQRSFLFSHDDKGNEIKMLLLDAKENQLLSETYEVVTIDEKGEWLEKWGYRNDEIRPITFYHKKKSK